MMNEMLIFNYNKIIYSVKNYYKKKNLKILSERNDHIKQNARLPGSRTLFSLILYMVGWLSTKIAPKQIKKQTAGIIFTNKNLHGATKKNDVHKIPSNPQLKTSYKIRNPLQRPQTNSAG